MWSCKYDMAVMSCSTRGSSFSVSRLVNPPQPLLCLVTLRLTSSLSLISLIIVSYDVIKIVIVENVTLILFLCILVPYPSLFSSPTPPVLLCVFYAMYAHLSATICLYLSAVFDSILWVCGLYEFTLPSIPTVCNIWECRGESPGHACDSMRTPPWTKA